MGAGIAALTVGGKAFGKSFSMRNSNYIIFVVGRVLAFFTPRAIWQEAGEKNHVPRDTAVRRFRQEEVVESEDSTFVRVVGHQLSNPGSSGQCPCRNCSHWLMKFDSGSSIPFQRPAVTLASNLGVVELTLALHRVYQSPEDRIVWDVGHQAYVHKMLTGRLEQMNTIRSRNGLSGFPKREESPHDTFNTGHSSTSISAALGMARARDLLGQQHHVVAVIGDGALGAGMAFEALNDAGMDKTNLLVVAQRQRHVHFQKCRRHVPLSQPAAHPAHLLSHPRICRTPDRQDAQGPLRAQNPAADENHPQKPAGSLPAV